MHIYGAGPPGPDDFDADLPLRFTRGELRWRRAPLFLQWADGVVPRGAKVTYAYSTASFLIEIETSLMLGIVDMMALRAQSVIGTPIAATAIFRILNFIRLQGWFNSPCPSYEHFI